MDDVDEGVIGDEIDDNNQHSNNTPRSDKHGGTTCTRRFVFKHRVFSLRRPDLVSSERTP